MLRNCGFVVGEGDVGMDCSIVPLRHVPGKLSLVSTTDFFFPAIEDPEVQGAIACANVLSDMYSMGIDHIDTMLMLIAASSDMSVEHRFRVTELMMKGFNATAEAAGVKVTGGQTVLNPWPIIGGVASAVVRECNMVRPDGLSVGDIMVLTKPLGTQVAVNAKQMQRKNQTIPENIDVETMYGLSVLSMQHLNVRGARLMKRHDARGATDVTGFGIFGHATNLAKAQPKPLSILIHTMPCIAHTIELDAFLGEQYGLYDGVSAETSGGLLIGFPDHKCAEEFIYSMKEEDGCECWIVGEVIPRPPTEPVNSAILDPNRKTVSVSTLTYYVTNENLPLEPHRTLPPPISNHTLVPQRTLPPPISNHTPTPHNVETLVPQRTLPPPISNHTPTPHNVETLVPHRTLPPPISNHNVSTTPHNTETLVPHRTLPPPISNHTQHSVSTTPLNLTSVRHSTPPSASPPIHVSQQNVLTTPSSVEPRKDEENPTARTTQVTPTPMMHYQNNAVGTQPTSAPQQQPQVQCSTRRKRG